MRKPVKFKADGSGQKLSSGYIDWVRHLGRIEMNTTASCCQTCQRNAPVKYVEFYQNIGAVIMRFHKSIKANMCKSCIHKYFWQYTLTTLAIGWLGYISIFVAPVFIVMNICRYLPCLTMATETVTHNPIFPK